MGQNKSSVQPLAPQKLQSPADGWIKTNFILQEKEFIIDRSVVYSPSKRFAMINVDPWDKQYKIVIYDIVERRLVQIIHKPNKLVYWYWLDEYTISLMTQCYEDYNYTRYIYQFIDKSSSILQLISKSMLPFDDRDGSISRLFSSDSCRLTVHGHDFLLLKRSNFLLLPYDLTSTGPHLPPLTLNISEPTNVSINERLHVSRHYAFTYKNKLIFMFYDPETSGYATDQFLQIDITDIDVNRKEAVYELDASDPVLFVPEKLNKGSYMSGGRGKENDWLMYWQEGPIVVLHNVRKNSNDKVWILDLEKETIFEKGEIVNSYSLANLYRDYLILWSMVGKPEEVVYKFHWIGNKTPKLSDLCIIKLLQQDDVDLAFIRKYNVLSKF